MKMLVHDFAGHPFQLQLSRQLAARGHDVVHIYPVGLDGPKGKLAKTADDPTRLNIEGIALSATFQKYSPFRRFAAQRKYARDLQKIIREQQPDVVLSGNTPIDVQAQLLWQCRRSGVAFVHWVQDVYFRAIEFFVQQKFPAAAKIVVYPFRKLEQTVARHSHANVVIAPAFRDLLMTWGIPAHDIVLRENWAPLDEMQVQPKDNLWSREFGLSGHTVFLYSGTLGLKHRPDLIYRLAESLDDSCKVVVISEGVGRKYLEDQPPLRNLVLMGFQPYDRISETMGSADVLVATLEAAAGEFAVPSKILSYLCAGRPILLAAPATNLAASVVQQSGGGFVVDPDLPSEWTGIASRLAADAGLRAELSAKARTFAENSFDIDRIADVFETTLLSAAARRSAGSRRGVSVAIPRTS